MSALGALAVAAAQQRLSSCEHGPDAMIHYCAAKRLAENFHWKRVKLVFDPVPNPALVPRVGIDMAVPVVSSLLEQERALLPLDERRCFFCLETVALADEHLVYLYRAASADTHLLVVAHSCRKPSCVEETDAWLAVVRKKPATARRRCSQCGATETATKFLACGRCRLVNYCSKDCQREHWSSIHRLFCQTVTNE
jgi:hypothetical protein